VTVDGARISSGDAVPDGADPAELFDIEMDEFARMLAFIAPDRFGRLQGTELVQAEPTQNTADGGGRDTGLDGDLFASPALAAQPFDLLDHGLGRRLPEPMRPGGAILQSRQSFAAISVNPLPNGPRADACGFGDGLRRLPAINLSYNPFSTARREPGILVHVHPVLPRIAEASQLQLPRPGPGGQPDESSPLARFQREGRVS
jgi:hypothetical protein